MEQNSIATLREQSGVREGGSILADPNLHELGELGATLVHESYVRHP
jgi:hypothetical protein